MITITLLIAVAVTTADARLPTVQGTLVAKHAKRSIEVKDENGTTSVWLVDEGAQGLGGVMVILAPWNKEQRAAEQYTGKIPLPISRRDIEGKLRSPSYRVDANLLQKGVVAFNDDSVRPAITGVYEGQTVLIVNESLRPKISMRFSGIAKVYRHTQMPPRSVRRFELQKGSDTYSPRIWSSRELTCG